MPDIKPFKPFAGAAKKDSREIERIRSDIIDYNEKNHKTDKRPNAYDEVVKLLEGIIYLDMDMSKIKVKDEFEERARKIMQNLWLPYRQHVEKPNSEIDNFFKDAAMYASIALMNRARDKNFHSLVTPISEMREDALAFWVRRKKSPSTTAVILPSLAQTREPFHFEGLREIGAGSFGMAILSQVNKPLFDRLLHEGLADKNNPYVIVKMPHPDLSSEELIEAEKERVLNDAIRKNYLEKLEEAISQKKPPPILPCNLAGSLEVDGKIVLFSKYAPGGDLQSYLDAKSKDPKNINAEYGLKCFRQMLEQVNAFHDGINDKTTLHRDIDIANFLVGQDGLPILNDLGKAISYDSQGNKNTSEKYVNIEQTIRLKLMANQVLYDGAYDRGTDLYMLKIAMIQTIATLAGIDSGVVDEKILKLNNKSNPLEFYNEAIKKDDNSILQELLGNLTTQINAKYPEPTQEKVQLLALTEACSELLSHQVKSPSEHIDHAFKSLAEAEKNLAHTLETVAKNLEENPQFYNSPPKDEVTPTETTVPETPRLG